MKRYRLHIWPIWLLLGMIFLAACQSDALPGDDMGGGKPIVARSDSSYINLRIIGNSQVTTRATFSDQATAAENAVYDGILCIFEGTGEASATLKTAAYIDQLINNPGSEANSQTVNVTQHLSIGKLPADSELYRYVFVLLNTTSTGFKVSGNDLLFDGASQAGMTISQIQNLQIHSVGSTDKHVGLFMSNAPQVNESGEISIMPEATALFDTEAEAQAKGDVRVTINVERAAARVKVSSNILSGDNISNVSLYDGDNDGSNNPKAKFHKMTWTINKYNFQSYAIRKGSTATNNWAEDFNYTSAPEKSYTAWDFNLYPQKSYSGDDIYIGENTTETPTSEDNVTEVIVEVQLKDNNNMLMHECFKFNFVGELITSPAQYFNHMMNGWNIQRSNYGSLVYREAAEVFKYGTIMIKDNGDVDITLKNDSFSDTEKDDLKILEEKLEDWTRGYRDGKMYYTYKIKHSDTQYGVVRNNAYNLTLSTIMGIGRPTP